MNCNKSGYIMIRPYSHDIIDIHSLLMLILSQGIILPLEKTNRTVLCLMSYTYMFFFLLLKYTAKFFLKTECKCTNWRFPESLILKLQTQFQEELFFSAFPIFPINVAFVTPLLKLSSCLHFIRFCGYIF